MVRVPWSRRGSEASPSMLSQISDWIKFAVIAAPLVGGMVGASIKVFERYTAVPQLQADVKTLKRETRKIRTEMRYITRGIRKLTRDQSPMPALEVEPDVEAED